MTRKPSGVSMGEGLSPFRRLVGARRWTPWEGRGRRADWALLVVIAAVVAFGAVLRPLRPFLIASHPVALAVLDGGWAAIGTGAAFARVGEVPLWLVVLAGAVGMAKFDWLTWWAGRRWGRGLLAYFMTNDRATSYAARAATAPRSLLGLGVFVSPWPGVPSALVCILAGWARMRLATFLALNLAGVLVTTTIVVAVGYLLGQSAIDLVLLVDRYAGWVSLGLISVTLAIPLVRQIAARRRRPRRPDKINSGHRHEGERENSAEDLGHGA